MGRQGSRMNFWKYRQLHHFFEIHGRNIRDPSTLTPFERLFTDDAPTAHIVSELYSLLTSATAQVRPAYVRRWESDLGTILTETQLTHLYQLTHSSSIDSRTQETNFKLLSRWYRVPADLANIYTSMSPLCWRGCNLRGTLLHIWWDCPLVRPFWEDIRDQIKVVTGVEIPFSPKHFLLHVPTIPIQQYKKCMLPHLLNAARRLLPVHWKTSRIPTRGEWIAGVNAVREAEDWIATCRDTRERFNTIWAPWSDYTTDPIFVPSSLDIALLELSDPSLKARRLVQE